MRPSFHGAKQGVTGSCHLRECAGLKVLVDCGMYQGGHEIAEENTRPFGFDPAQIDFLLLTHAHLDHCGRIPPLVREGFEGAIITTGASRDLAKLVLLDSAHLQEEEARRAARWVCTPPSPCIPWRIPCGRWTSLAVRPPRTSPFSSARGSRYASSTPDTSWDRRPWSASSTSTAIRGQWSSPAIWATGVAPSCAHPPHRRRPIMWSWRPPMETGPTRIWGTRWRNSTRRSWTR